MKRLPPTGNPQAKAAQDTQRRYIGQSHGSTKLPPVQDTRVIFAPSTPKPILRNNRDISPGYATEVSKEFRLKAKTLLFSEQMKTMAELLASGDNRDAGEIVAEADEQALQKVANIIYGTNKPEEMPPRARLIVSGNRRPTHQTAMEVIRREELAKTEHGRKRLDQEDAEKFGKREVVGANMIDYPEPQNHDGIYRGSFEDTYRALDGHLTTAEWQQLPLTMDARGVVQEAELPRAPMTANDNTITVVVGNCVTEIAAPKPQPFVPVDNPYAKQRLLQFQIAAARGKISHAEVASLCEAAGMPEPSVAFGRN